MRIEKDIREKIAKRMKELNLNTVQVANLTNKDGNGLSRPTISRVLKTGKCDVNTLDAICRALGLELKIEA